MIDSNKDIMIKFNEIEPETEETNETETADSASGNDVKESMKSEIIKYAMSKIGTKRVSTLDGMTLEYKNKCYNIYVDDNNVTVEEIKEETVKDVEKVCGDCSHFNACTQSNQTIASTCCMYDSLYKARKNPEWHHVRLAKLANIDIEMLDEKRQRYLKMYKELIKTVNDLHKCKTAATYENRWRRFKQAIADDINYRGTTLYMTRFLDSKISMCNVECGLWCSADEKATSFIKSRRYRSTTLK